MKGKLLKTALITASIISAFGSVYAAVSISGQIDNKGVAVESQNATFEGMPKRIPDPISPAKFGPVALPSSINSVQYVSPHTHVGCEFRFAVDANTGIVTAGALPVVADRWQKPVCAVAPSAKNDGSFELYVDTAS